MQIKITMRYHYISIRMPTFQNTVTTSNASEDVEQQKLLHIAGGDAKCYSHFGRQFDNVLQYDTAIVLIDIFPEELTIYVHRKTCMWMSIKVLFIIAHMCRQP